MTFVTVVTVVNPPKFPKRPKMCEEKKQNVRPFTYRNEKTNFGTKLGSPPPAKKDNTRGDRIKIKQDNKAKRVPQGKIQAHAKARTRKRSHKTTRKKNAAKSPNVTCPN